MELWVRSQDKECLVKVSRIDVDGTNIIIWDNDYRCSETYMGEYKTKERALGVLDEIQKMDFTNNENVTLTNYGYVYEMPKE